MINLLNIDRRGMDEPQGAECPLVDNMSYIKTLSSCQTPWSFLF